ncbi:SRR1-domain-containing protein [Mycena rebaudengoi]|nr:SRR1-domain-containing protein [Mycena rebaudengoi]
MSTSVYLLNKRLGGRQILFSELLQDHLTARLLSPSQIICLGLGSPSSSSNSRAQLAFLLGLCESLAIEHSNVCVYDPIFSDEDMDLFKELRIRVLPENEAAQNGNYPLKAPTILWMPHCDMDLYENVLRANWSCEQLRCAILVSNRLGDYIDSNPRYKLEKRVPCILRIEEYTDCYLLPVSTAFTTAFNSIAIQSIGPKAKGTEESWFTEIAQLPSATENLSAESSDPPMTVQLPNRSKRGVETRDRRDDDTEDEINSVQLKPK